MWEDKVNMDNNVNMDNANNLKPLLAKISEFVLPVESRNATQDSPSEWLDKILNEKLQKYSPGMYRLSLSSKNAWYMLHTYMRRNLSFVAFKEFPWEVTTFVGAMLNKDWLC